MYHMYNVELQNEGFDWHVYAESQENARNMVDALNRFMFQGCRGLADSISYDSIASKLRAGEEYISERGKIKSFFSGFRKPFIRQDGAMGGYALDYRKCSVSAKAEMPFHVMLSYLDMEDADFSILSEIGPVNVRGGEIDIPDFDVPISLVAYMDRNNECMYGNEALLGFAGAKLNFQVGYGGEAENGAKDIYLAELNNLLQFCQLLNYLPFLEVVDITCL